MEACPIGHSLLVPASGRLDGPTPGGLAGPPTVASHRYPRNWHAPSFRLARNLRN
jgi:hypothetical protein